MSGNDSTSIFAYPRPLVPSLPKVCSRSTKVRSRLISHGTRIYSVVVRWRYGATCPREGVYEDRMVPLHAIHHQAPPVTMLSRRSIFFVDFSRLGETYHRLAGRSAERRAFFEGEAKAKSRLTKG